MVPQLEEAFRAVGRTVGDYVTLQMLDPACHAFFADGSRLLVRPGHEKMREVIEAESGRKDARAFDDFVGVREDLPEATGHHNIHFGEAWSDAFTDLLVRSVPMRDRSRFIAVPSRDDPGAAPEGARTLYALEPVPNLAVGRLAGRRRVRCSGTGCTPSSATSGTPPTS